MVNKLYFKVTAVNRSLVLICFCFLSNILFSQNLLDKKVSVNARGQSLESVLDEISTNTGVSFIYNSDLVANKSVNIVLLNESVDKILTSVLSDEFDYVARGKYVIIQGKEKTQKVTIQLQGSFTDASTGEKLDNTTIYEAKNLTSSISNNQGNYNLTFDTDDEEPALIVSKENYKDTVITIKEISAKEFNIQLQPKPPSIQPRESLHNQIMVRLLTTEEMRKNDKNINFLDEVPFQISLVPAVSTNRLMGGTISNRLSLNVIAGYSYGLSGLELGGAVNIIRKEAHGVQLGGLGNVVGGHASGVQMAGGINTNLGNTKGLQMAGAANFVKDKFQGVQMAGFFNVAKQNRSVQAAGGFNLVLKDSEGLQMAGALNIAGSNRKTWQMAGAGNVTFKQFGGWQLGGAFNYAGDTKGSQMAGALNISRDMNGGQLAGAINYARNTSGLQMAGAINIARDMTGAQIAGFVNYAKEVRGTQIGIINIADTISGGVPIGLINIVKKGYIHMEAGSNDITPIRVAFKSGTKRLYTILSSGLRPSQEVWSVGAGLGTHFTINKYFYSSIEISSNWLNTLDEIFIDTNSWTQYHINFGYDFSDNLSINFGPTFNTYWSDYLNTETGTIGLLDNEGFSEKTNNGKLTRHWIGWQAGLIF